MGCIPSRVQEPESGKKATARETKEIQKARKKKGNEKKKKKQEEKGVSEWVECAYCGQKVREESYEKFHKKECKKKQDNLDVPCPVCDKIMRKGALLSHFDNCSLGKGNQFPEGFLQNFRNALKAGGSRLPCRHCQRTCAPRSPFAGLMVDRKPLKMWFIDCLTDAQIRP